MPEIDDLKKRSSPEPSLESSLTAPIVYKSIITLLLIMPKCQSMPTVYVVLSMVANNPLPLNNDISKHKTNIKFIKVNNNKKPR